MFSRKTFKKKERLKSSKIIDQLFRNGQSFGVYPLRLVWLKLEVTETIKFPVKFALSVPRRKFPNAVDRNKLKRKIRETYRLHKHLLYQNINEPNTLYAFMVLYTGKEFSDFQKIEHKMKKLIHRFLKERLQ